MTALTSDESLQRYDRITLRAITIAFALSVFVHFAVWWLPAMHEMPKEMRAPADERGPLSVTIAAKEPQKKAEPAQPSPPLPPEVVKPTRPAPPPRATLRPRPAPPRESTPPVVALESPANTTVAPPAAAPPQEVDLSAFIEARRRARGDPAPSLPAETDDERGKRIALANIAHQKRTGDPGSDIEDSGGIFQIKRIGYTDAEFLFRGWSTTARRTWAQQVEVRQGNNPDIRIAIVRKMIEIIREQKPGDFVWESHRLGKNITMSARIADTPKLEAFLIREFFPNDPRGRG